MRSLKDRFLKYISFDTASDENSESIPSSKKQLALAKYLEVELRAIGLKNVELDEYGYVYGFLPASPGREDEPTVGLIAHMDTSPAVSGENINPRCFIYEGGDIDLGNGEVTRVEEFPCLNDCIGQELIVTDGTTLLGGDDKAGVAEIYSVCEILALHPETLHGRIAVCITPDEEIGRGADHFDIEKFGAKWAYTVDGGAIGEIEYENFNAASAKLTVKGMNIHPGSAKNRMKNAALLASEFISAMPAAETPSHTEGYEGFYHLREISGNESKAVFEYIIRDHDREKFEARKQFITELVGFMNKKYGEGTFTLELRDSYYNMKEKILPYMEIVELAKKAMEDAGVTPIIRPIRGGTDGARLSFEGLPCPNLSTGGYNCHGIHEFVSVDQMEKMVGILKNIVCEKR